MHRQRPKATRSDQLKRPGISRRGLLRRLGIVGAAGGVFAAGAGLGAWLSGGPRIVVLPHGAAPPGQGRPAASANARAGPRIISREDWGALPVDLSARNEYGLYDGASNPYGWYAYSGDLAESYQTLVAHHSAFYAADGVATLLEVQRLHRQDRGWADIGYHFLVDKDGTIYAGRSLAARGVHTAGHNTGSAGVCFLGDFREEAPPAAQWSALIALGRWLVTELELTHIAAHNQFNWGTVCPGAKVVEGLPGLAEALGLAYGVDGYVPSARADAGCDCCGCAAQM